MKVQNKACTDFEKLIYDSKYIDLLSLQNNISKVMLDCKYSADIFTTFTFNGFYRARKHNNLYGNSRDGKLVEFINEKEFWNVPEKNAKIGRCNEEGKSLFYCSSDLVTAILEVKPQEGDFISVANFKNLFSDDKPMFRIQPIGKTYLMQIPELRLLFENYILDESQFEIEDFLDNLFHQIIKDDELYKYKLSIAVANIFFTHGTNVNKEIIETDGLLYPSIIRNKKSYCFVLKPWIVHCYFEIIYVQTFEILEIKENSINIKLVRNGKPIFKKLYPADLFDIFWKEPEREIIETIYF
jgi:hypothetical protein